MTSLQDFDVTTFESTNLSTLNTTQDRHEEQMGFAWIIITSVILCFMTITTIIGNVFVIAAILLERNLQSVANYLILSLAVADLLVAVLVMPLGAIYEISLEWTFGPILCDMWTSSDVLCCTASILHLLAIAIDRYWAVTQVHYIHSRTSRTIGSMIFFIWLISVIVSLAPLLGWKDPDFETRVNIKKECIVSQDVGYQIFATMATFYVPLVLILLLYWRIFLTARNRLRNRLAQKANVHNYNDKKVTKQPYHAPNAGVVEVSATVRNSKVTKIEAKVLVKSTSDSSDSVSNKNEETAFVTRNDVELREPNQNLNRILPKIKSMSCGNHLHEGKTNFNSEDSESCGTQSQLHQPSPVTRRSSSLQMQKSPFNMLQDTRKNNDVSISGPRFQDQACQTESNKRKKRRTTKKKSNFLNPSLSIKMPVKKVEVDKVAEKLCKKNHISLEARRERKAAKTLAIVTGAFIACWLPFFILALVMPFFKEYQFNRILVSFFLWLGYFNSTLNPIIYTIFSPEFRSAFQRILCGKTNNINHRPRHLQ